MRHTNFYHVLGLREFATNVEIKASYRSLVKKFHPDSPSGGNSIRFREVQEAYNILIDPVTRREYDISIGVNSSHQKKGQGGATGFAKENSNSTRSMLTVCATISNGFTVFVNSGKTKLDATFLEMLFRETSSSKIETYRLGSASAKVLLINEMARVYPWLSKNEGVELKKRLAPLINEELDIEQFQQLFKKAKRKNRSMLILNFLNRNPQLTQIGGILVLFLTVSLIASIVQLFDNDSRQRPTYTPRTSVSVPATEVPEIDRILEAQENLSKPRIPSTSEQEIRKYPGNRLPEELIDSKWEGNQLVTGASPYDHYFNKGVYNHQYHNWIMIDNAQEVDVVVCLVDYHSQNRTIRNEYIRAGESFKMTSIPSGTYFIKYFFGNDWNPEIIKMRGRIKGGFMTSAGFKVSDNPGDLIKLTQSVEEYSTYTIWLKPQIKGNMESRNISEEDFF